MKIQLLSDTHGSPYYLDPNADLIIHAGDFGNGLSGAIAFHETCQKMGKPYVFVLGNHDFYHENMTEVYQAIKKLKLNCLFEGQTFEFGGWTFVGGTLFSNFRKNRLSPFEHKAFRILSENNVADFHYILDYQPNSKQVRRLTGEDYCHFFERQLSWIKQFRNQPNTVVITHFPPSAVCQDSQYDGSPLNPYFINDIDVHGFKYWFSGHTHSAINTVYQGCQLVINPLGYPNEQGKNGFVQSLLIEL